LDSSALNQALQTGNYTETVTIDDLIPYLRALLDLHDKGILSVFDLTTFDFPAFELYMIEEWEYSAADAAWARGYLEKSYTAGTPEKTGLKFTKHCFEEGLPAADSPLDYAHEIGVYSNMFWGDSKRIDWNAVATRVADIGGGLGGFALGNQVAGPWGGRLGAGIGATVASTGYELAIDACQDLMDFIGENYGGDAGDDDEDGGDGGDGGDDDPPPAGW